MTFYQFLEFNRLCAKLDSYLPIARETHLTPIAIAPSVSYAREIGGF